MTINAAKEQYDFLQMYRWRLADAKQMNEFCPVSAIDEFFDTTVRCEDCGTPYKDLGLDMVLPDELWLMIHPEGMGGILCASCIVKRAEELEGTTVVLAEIDI